MLLFSLELIIAFDIVNVIALIIVKLIIFLVLILIEMIIEEVLKPVLREVLHSSRKRNCEDGICEPVARLIAGRASEERVRKDVAAQERGARVRAPAVLKPAQVRRISAVHGPREIELLDALLGAERAEDLRERRQREHHAASGVAPPTFFTGRPVRLRIRSSRSWTVTLSILEGRQEAAAMAAVARARHLRAAAGRRRSAAS